MSEKETAVFVCESRHRDVKQWHDYLCSEGEDSWRPKDKGERMKTVYVGLVLCLNIGVDPPDVKKPQPCARFECWMNPMQLANRAMDTISHKLQKQYERWQPRARYKHAPDPTMEDVKKLCQSLRRNAKEDRVLFHYNGHGVPKPTNNGEIWVFNKNYTQYIPLSLYDLQVWLGAPSVYIWDCNYAARIVKHFIKFANDHDRENTKQKVEGSEIQVRTTSYHNCIQLAACGEDEMLPTIPDVPADLFTSCLTTPIQTAVMCYVHQHHLAHKYPPEIWKNIPGDSGERKSMLGELNWIFTAVTDTVAWNCLPPAVFQRLFRQDLLVASLFRNFLLADRIMRVYSCIPKSNPPLPCTFDHPLWQAWDLALDRCLVPLQNRGAVNNGSYALPSIAPLSDELVSYSCSITQPQPSLPVAAGEYTHSGFFADQLDAFEVWLRYGHLQGGCPQQLPVVLQVLLSQVLRLRALQLLGRFVDKGAWAVKASLSVGIFPYVLKLLLCTVAELRCPLAFIWAKILAVDPNCLTDLINQGGHKYFMRMCESSDIPCKKKVIPAFVLAIVASDSNAISVDKNDKLTGQQALFQCNYTSMCTSMLLGECVCARVRLWILLGVGKLWSKFDEARWQAIRAGAQTMVSECLEDPSPEVRAAAIYALGCLVSNISQHNEHASMVDHSVCAELCRKCSTDASPLARRELVVAVHWFILEFEKQFVTLSVDLLRKVENEKRNMAKKNLNFDERLTTSTLPRSPSFGGDGPVMQSAKVNGGVLGSNRFTGLRYTQSMSVDSGHLGEEWATRHDLIQQMHTLSDHMHNVSAPALATFGNAYSQVWLTVLRLSCDPAPCVSDLAEKVILYILSKAKAAQILQDESDLLSSPRISKPRPSGAPMVSELGPAPGASGRASELRGNKPAFIIGSPGCTESLDSPDCSRTPPRMSISEDVLTALPTVNTAAGLSGHSTTFTPTRRSTTSKPEGPDTRGLMKRKSALIETDLVDQSASRFAESVLHLLEDDTNATKRGLGIRYMQVSEWALETKQKINQLANKQFSAITNRTQRLENQKFVCRLPPGNSPATVVCFRPLENALFAAIGDTVHVYDHVSGQARGKFDADVCRLWPHNTSRYINWLENVNPWTHAYVMSGTPSGRVRIHDCGDDKHLLSDRLSAPPLVTGFQVMGEEETLVSRPCKYWWAQDTGMLITAGGSAKCIRMWDMNCERLHTEINVNDAPTSLTADSTGSKVVAAGFADGSVRFYDRRMPHNEAPTNKLRGLSSPILNVTYVNASVDTIVAGAEDGQVRVWQPRNFAEPTASFKPVAGNMSNMNVHNRGLLACSSSASGVEITDLNGQSVGSVRFHDGMMGHRIMTPTAIKFHWDQAAIAVATSDRFLAVHSLP